MQPFLFVLRHSDNPGRHRSRPMDDIVEEVKMLVAKGVKEFQFIAQDLCRRMALTATRK